MERLPTQSIGCSLALCLLLGMSPEASAQSWEILLSRGDSLVTAGQYAEAAAPLETALRLVEAERAPDDPAVATVLLSLGKCLYLLADYPTAELHWKRSLEIREKRYGLKSLDVARCLNNLATLYKSTARYAEAEPMYRRAMDIRVETLGPDHPDVAASANNMANFLLLLARYSEAEQLYQQALSIYEKARGEDHDEVAAALNNLGALYHVQARYRDEEPLYRRALEIYEGNHGHKHAHVAQCLTNLAIMYHDQGNLLDAEPLYQEALTVGESVYGTVHPKVAATLSDLSRLYNDMDRLDEAEPLILRALNIMDSTANSSKADAAEFRKNLADLYQQMGRYDEARAAYARALTEIEQAAGKDHPVAAMILHGMAMLALAEQNTAQAVLYQQQAYVIHRKKFSDGFGSLSERAALEYSLFLQTSAYAYLSTLLASQDGESANRDEIAKVVFSTKGLVTDGISVRHRATSAIAALVDSLNQARIRLSKLYVEGPDPAKPWVHQTDIAKATERKEKFEAELARSSTGFRSEKIITQVDAAKVAAQLPAGTALVEFMRYQHYTSLAHSEARYLAVVVKSNGRVSAFSLGSVADVDSAVAGYRRHMADLRKLNMADYLAISADLYHLLWEPIASQVAGLGAIFVSPDGALCLMSFAGLVKPDGEYLVEQFPIHYVSSGRDLVRETETVQRGSGLFAIGDPDYDATPDARMGKSSGMSLSNMTSGIISLTRGSTSGCRALRDMMVARLPGTRTEVSEVVGRWQGSVTEPATVLLDASASEDAFKLNCFNKRVLHLATHGYFISGECRANNSTRSVIGESPLLESGLFFAGANLKGTGSAEAGIEDGTLTAEEVVGLNLRGTQLVVLSACETGLGEVKAGEGVFGLRRAFQMAGARTVISALWPVDDRSTAELMSSLFTISDAPLYDALRRSALSTIKARRDSGKSDHPFYWAGFIATGDWQTR